MAFTSLVLFGVLFVFPKATPGAEPGQPARTNAVRADELFGQPRVWPLKIEIPSASLEALKKDPRAYVKGTIREGERVYANAGIRVKGNGTFQSQEKKPGLAIKFNEFNSNLGFHGHGKIFLDNGHQDPACLSEALGSDIFRAAGVPAAKVTFAHVELNGRDLGLYVLEEAVNRDFLAEYFKKTKGNLYEGSHTDITDKLEKDSGDTSKDQADVKKLADAAREPDPAQRMKKLATVLDLDRFISFAAAEVLAWHHSGYAMARNNYRLYHDPETERMVFIPHGLDGLFSKPTGPLMPEWKGFLAKSVLENPECQRRYRERMATLLGNGCKAEVLQARLNELAGIVRPALERDAAQTKAFDAAVTVLRDRIGQRIHFLDAELKKAPR